ncbi:hypothetical protein HNY73_021025 [Argiope bruennichi]|uniref:Ig-like domain-containing protein n=1 Tax=Argiope bruennichi TaxID=94029 RepID=A0A8T0E8M8_ARGBR|nr:hypothetical protein HNY73_021025 [Argiope bruennichi]
MPIVPGAYLWLAAASLLLLPGGFECLRLRMLQVPDSVEVGEVARLVCIFDEEQDDLYSVKWYKDDVEFFRFLPNDRPANQFFEIGDVDVDMSRSSNGTVYLQNTSLLAEGTYRCEVSADAPSFQSISLEKFMSVQDRPPVIPSAGHLPCWTSVAILLPCLLVLP